MPERGSTGRARAATPKSSRKTAASLSAAAMGKRLREQPKNVPQPPANWRDGELRALLDQWGAFGSFIGRRKKAGRVLREICLVVVTTRKHEPGRGKDRVKRVPRFVRWKDGRHTYRLPTDVQEVAQHVKLHAGNVLGPGDAATVGPSRGSIGAAVVHPSEGRCVLTAGHVVVGGSGAIGSPATLMSETVDFPARVVDFRQQATVDYAVIVPDPPVDCDNLFWDEYRVGPVYTPTASDVGKAVYLLDGSGNVRTLSCQGVGGQFETTGGTFVDVIQTEAKTCDGESGGTLIDDSRNVWGFLIGQLGDQYALFAPAHLILAEAGVQFIQ